MQRQSIGLEAYKLYAAAIKSGLHFGLLISIHNSSSFFAAKSFFTVKGLFSYIKQNSTSVQLSRSNAVFLNYRVSRYIDFVVRYVRKKPSLT